MLNPKHDIQLQETNEDANREVRLALKGPAKQRAIRERAKRRRRVKSKTYYPWESNAQFMQELRASGKVTAGGRYDVPKHMIQTMWDACVAYNVKLADVAMNEASDKAGEGRG